MLIISEGAKHKYKYESHGYEGRKVECGSKLVKDDWTSRYLAMKILLYAKKVG
jgi:hypothetical protein